MKVLTMLSQQPRPWAQQLRSNGKYFHVIHHPAPHCLIVTPQQRYRQGTNHAPLLHCSYVASAEGAWSSLADCQLVSRGSRLLSNLIYFFLLLKKHCRQKPPSRITARISLGGVREFWLNGRRVYIVLVVHLILDAKAVTITGEVPRSGENWLFNPILPIFGFKV